MKNQYFGDVNDYRKYGLIRALIGSGELSSMICWMLTRDDDRRDGGKLDYLLKPKPWREYDLELYRALHESVVLRGERHVRVAMEQDIIPNAAYYEALLADDESERAEYFDRFYQVAQGKDLYFFDPDNGMEVPSASIGRKNLSKYLFWRELEKVQGREASVLIYQHFPREGREAFIARMFAEFKVRTEYDEFTSFRTSHVVFFLLALHKHRARFESAITDLSKQWGDQFEIQTHLYASGSYTAHPHCLTCIAGVLKPKLPIP